jgi:hypothetical protein
MGGVLWWMRDHTLIESMTAGFVAYAVCLGLLGEFAEEYRGTIGYLKRSKT